MQKQILNIWKIMIKTRIIITRIFRWEQLVWMSQKPPANGLKWIEELSQFKEGFIKNY